MIASALRSNGFKVTMSTSQTSQTDGSRGGASGIGAASSYDATMQAEMNRAPKFASLSTNPGGSLCVEDCIPGFAAGIGNKLSSALVEGGKESVSVGVVAVGSVAGGIIVAAIARTGFAGVSAYMAGDVIGAKIAVAELGSLGAALATDGAVTAPAVAGLKGSAAPATKSMTTLFRAVTESEFQQVQRTGAFEAGKNSLEGKWFAEAAEHARKWGDIMNGSGNSRILKVQVPADQADKFFKSGNLDGIGPARYGELDQLKGALITEAE